MSSNEPPSFVVRVEMTDEYVESHGAHVAKLSQKNPPDRSTPGLLIFRFRAPERPLDAAIALTRGLTLRGEDADPSFIAGLPPLPENLQRAIEERNRDAILRDDSRVESCAAPPDEYEQHLSEQHYQDEQSRVSFSPDEPDIKAQWSGTDNQRNESKPATNAAPKKGAVSLGELFESEDSSDATICAPLGISFGDRPMLIVGAFGTAKTWVMIKLALEFATGRPLFGNPAWPINRPLRVFIFDYELNRKVYKKRLRELCETMGIDYQTIRENIYYYERPKFFLTDQRAYDRFLEESKDFDVILGDALRGAAPNVDENKSEFRKNLDVLHDVATAGNKFVCWLHHAGKDENSRFRGTSGIGDAAGVMFTVTNDTKDRRAPKKLHHEKLGSNGDDFVDDFFIQLKRDERDDGNGPMRITFMTEEESKAQLKAEPIEKEEWLDTKKKILKKLQSSAGISRNELYDAVKGNRATFDKVLKHLVEKLRYVENQGTATNHKYAITTAGKEWLDKGSRYAAPVPKPNAPTNPGTSNAAEPTTRDDPPFAGETIAEQSNEKNTMKNQSDTVDANVKKVVEYIAEHPKCSKTEVKIYTKMQTGRAVAARDKAEREGLISWSIVGGNIITAKGRDFLGLPPSAPSSPDNAPEASSTTHDPPDAPKDL